MTTRPGVVFRIVLSPIPGNTKAGKELPMDFTISERAQTITEMMDEFVKKELIPMEPEFSRRPFVELVPDVSAEIYYFSFRDSEGYEQDDRNTLKTGCCGHRMFFSYKIIGYVSI